MKWNDDRILGKALQFVTFVNFAVIFMPSLKKCNWKVSVRYPCHLFLHFLHLFVIVIVLCVVNNKIQTHKTYWPEANSFRDLYNSLHRINILPKIYLWYYLHITFFQVFACFMYFGFACPCFLFFYILVFYFCILLAFLDDYAAQNVTFPGSSVETGYFFKICSTPCTWITGSNQRDLINSASFNLQFEFDGLFVLWLKLSFLGPLTS